MTEFISLGSNCAITYQLNKYGLRNRAYPFDWVKISLNQLNNILENNFDDFVESLELKKISEKHEYFGLDINSINSTNTSIFQSAILTNKYSVEFAHEILNSSEIDYFKSRLDKRIERFRNLTMILNKFNLCFIRIETSPIKLTWVDEINKLIKLLKKYYVQFKLILIINSKSEYQQYFPEFVKIFKFTNFSADWKMDNLNWNEILICK